MQFVTKLPGVKLMKIKRFPLLTCMIALGSSLLLFEALPAQAQTQSDISGAITTTSDIAGAAFSPGAGSSTITTFTSPAVGAAVEQVGASLSAQLSGGALQVAASDIPGSIPASVQQSLLSLLSGAGNASVASQFEQALANAPGAAGNGQNAALVNTLTAKLKGLLGGGEECIRRRRRNEIDDPKNSACRITATKLRAAVEAYNALIDASSAETLRNPPPELLAIRATLSRLVDAALNAKR